MFAKCLLLLASATLLVAHRLATPHHLQSNGRIINGKNEDIKNVPWQVSLQYINVGHHCGGSIYKDNIIVTAAHCVNQVSPKDVEVRVGSSNNKSGGTIYKVAAFKIHESYAPPALPFDIAVVRLSTPLTLSETVKPIPLAEKSPAHNSNAIVTGWGFINWFQYPEFLQRIDVPVISNEKCKLLYGSAITEDMICSGRPLQTVCGGDSGGPMVVDGKLAGVVSFVPGGCLLPGGFADVAFFRTWIEQAAASV